MTPLEALLGHTLISPDNTWGLLAVMCLSVALTIALEQRYRWASRVSGAMIALVFSMAMANLGVIPPGACSMTTSSGASSYPWASRF